MTTSPIMRLKIHDTLLIGFNTRLRIAFAGIEVCRGVFTRSAFELVGLSPASKCVSAVFTQQFILAALAQKLVIAPCTVQFIVAVATTDQVVAGSGVDLIFAARAQDDIIAIGAFEFTFV